MRDRLARFLGASGRAIVWLGAVLLIALGAAGIVAGMDAPPGGGSRPELTAAGDARVTASLDVIEGELSSLADAVDALGVQARGALAALASNKFDIVDGAVANGDGLMTSIRERSATISAQLATLPLIDTPDGAFEVSDAVRARRDRLAASLKATSGLDAAWARLTVSSVAASRMSTLLAAHDDAVLRAAEQGRAAHYDAGIAILADADAAIASARALRDRLVNTVDVTTIDAWLDRNAAYDTALKGLYVALRDVGGRVTNAVRNAIAAEKAAKDQLPADTRGLVLIMADIGRGGMTDAIIAIEGAKGQITQALEPDAGASPSP